MGPQKSITNSTCFLLPKCNYHNSVVRSESTFWTFWVSIFGTLWPPWPQKLSLCLVFWGNQEKRTGAMQKRKTAGCSFLPQLKAISRKIGSVIRISFQGAFQEVPGFLKIPPGLMFMAAGGLDWESGVGRGTRCNLPTAQGFGDPYCKACKRPGLAISGNSSPPPKSEPIPRFTT